MLKQVGIGFSSVLSAAILWSPSVHAIDSFNSTTNVLTIPSIQVGATQYANVQAKIGTYTVVNVGDASASVTVDTFNPQSDLLSIGSINVDDAATYSNVMVRLGPEYSVLNAESASPVSVTSRAAALASKLKKPSRLLVGLGTGASESSVQAQGLKPDINDAYLVGVGADAWPTWNSPSGAYVNVAAAKADKMGAAPMFTFYQMASNGDGNLSGINDPVFMEKYWVNVRLLYQRLSIYGKPAMVNFEPDFWGYVQQQSPGNDPRRLPAKVSRGSGCADQPDNAVGIAACLVELGRKYAPNALLGFSPSTWGGNSAQEVANYMSVLGAQYADFTAVQTLDRDAGCFEVQGQNCSRGGSGWYWDDNAYRNHLSEASTYAKTIGLPLVWWQTPMGFPSSAAGGSPGRYRDNRMQYFLTHPTDLTAIGGAAVIFSVGAGGQTNIDTDGGQFKRLSEAYLANPAPLK
ncbi:MAG: hypothetical protein ABIZ09_08440 [Rhodoferax sp.]